MPDVTEQEPPAPIEVMPPAAPTQDMYQAWSALVSPVPDIHREWVRTHETNQGMIPEAVGRQRCHDFLEALLNGLAGSKCFDLEHPKKFVKCTCMSSLQSIITVEEKSIVASFMHSFAKRDWHGQRLLVVEWMKYGEIGKATNRHTQNVYLLPGSSQHLICKSSLAKLIGWGRYAWNRLMKCMRADTSAPVHALVGRKGNKFNISYDIMLRTFFNEIQELSSPRATQIVRIVARDGDEEELVMRDANNDVTELPSYVTKRCLYKRFVKEYGWDYHSSSRGAVSLTEREGEAQTEVPSICSFHRFWKEEFPDLIVTKPRADICGDCYIYANQSKYKVASLRRESANNKDSHSSEEEEDDEQEELTEEQRLADILASEQLILDAAEHVGMAKTQRDFVNEKKAEAFADKDKINSDRTYCFTADYCQNLYVPNFAGEQPGETYYISPVNAFTFGIVDNSQQPTKLAAYCYLEDQGKKGGNNVTSMLWQEMKRKGLVPEYDANNNIPEGHVPAKEVNIVLDNCGGQNKNRMLLRLLFFMVKRGLCKVARAIFLIRGHTKNDCDRMFNLLKINYRKQNIYTPKDLFKSINSHQDIDAIKPEGFYNWDLVQDRYLDLPQTIKKNHIFTVDSNRNPECSSLFVEKCNGETVQEQELLKWEYKYMGDWSAEDLAQPEMIEEPGIQDIKWREIFDKWGPLITAEKRKEWKYLHVDPGKERRDKVRDHTKASKKQRRERTITKENDGDGEDKEDDEN